MAMVLLHEPDVLLIGELSLGLAPTVVEELLEMVRDLAGAGITIILVEQSVNVALTLAEQDAVPAAEAWKPVVVVVGADPQDTVVRLQLATELRGAGIASRPDLTSRRLGKQLDGAAKAGAHFAVICGDELLSVHLHGGIGGIQSSGGFISDGFDDDIRGMQQAQ